MDTGSGMMSAPNQSEVVAQILSAKVSAKFPNKVELTIVLIRSEHLSGPNMLGDKISEPCPGFTFDQSIKLTEGAVVRAKAQYLGDAHDGVIELTELRPDVN